MARKSKFFKKGEVTFFKKLSKRVFAMVGFTYFSVAITLGDWTTFIPSLFAGCLYGFSELIRFYQVNQVVVPKKLNTFDFII